MMQEGPSVPPWKEWPWIKNETPNTTYHLVSLIISYQSQLLSLTLYIDHHKNNINTFFIPKMDQYGGTQGDTDEH